MVETKSILNIDKIREEFKQFKEEYDKEDKKREETINKSRLIVKNSKQAIYSLHREDYEKASTLLKESSEKLLEIIDHENITGSVNAAIEEFVEAKCFEMFLKNKTIPTREELNVPFEKYMCGLADFTGELVRLAVIKGTTRDIKEIEFIRNLVNDLMGSFLEIDLRNSDLRKKYDGIKWNLSKLEQMLYELKLKE